MDHGNIFSKIPNQLPGEIFEEIISSKTCKIERIISKGHSSPDGYWYDQEKNEWVIVLRGRAQLRFKDHDEVIEFGPGDYINLPAHCKHRVEWTDPNEETIWLAVHY